MILPRSYEKNIWSKYTIAIMARSDNDLAKVCNCTSQMIGSYRRGEQEPTDKFIENNTLNIYMSSLPSLLRGGGHYYAALRDYCIKYIYINDDKKKIEEYLAHLEEEAKVRPDFTTAILHLQATTWLISKHPIGKYLRYKKAREIHHKIQKTTSDSYWKYISESQNLYIDYHMMKYFSGDDEIILKEDAEKLISRSKAIATYLNTLILWINHIEIASVAENLPELIFADEKTARLIGIGSDLLPPTKIKYLWGAVFSQLESRDGLEFRTRHQHLLEVSAYEA